MINPMDLKPGLETDRKGIWPKESQPDYPIVSLSSRFRQPIFITSINTNPTQPTQLNEGMVAEPTWTPQNCLHASCYVSKTPHFNPRLLFLFFIITFNVLSKGTLYYLHCL